MLEPSDLAGQRPGEAGVVEIQLPQTGHGVDVVGYRPAEVAVGDVNFRQGRRRPTDAVQAGDGGVAEDEVLQILGPADVAEGDVDGRVVPQVEDLEVGQIPHLLGEGALDVVLAQVDLPHVADPLGAGIAAIAAVAVAVVVVAVAPDALPAADVRRREPAGVVGPLQPLGLVVDLEEDLHGVQVGADAVIGVIIGVAIIALGRGAAQARAQQPEEAEGREAPCAQEGRYRRRSASIGTATAAAAMAAMRNINCSSSSTAACSIAFAAAATS